MENEKVCKEHHMCDWCGNEYGRKYKWWRLILAILIGLFIFLAGIEIGQMRSSLYGEYGGHMMRYGQGYHGDYMMNDQYYGPDEDTTIVVPANPGANGPMVPAGATSPSTTQAGAVTH